MTRIISDISASLDGLVTLHTWAFSDDADDRRVLREGTARSGAVVRTTDLD